jgi:hypothetical protein
MTGEIGVVVDAQQKQVFLKRYRLEEGNHVVSVAGEPELLRIEELESSKLQLVGPEVLKWSGKGKEMFPSAEAFLPLIPMCEWVTRAEELKPVYLRKVEFRKWG